MTPRFQVSVSLVGSLLGSLCCSAVSYHLTSCSGMAVPRSFFLRIGGFDPEYGYGGGENLELSFRTWMCGGSVVCAPCSRVFIVFYKKHTNGAKRGHW